MNICGTSSEKVKVPHNVCAQNYEEGFWCFCCSCVWHYGLPRYQVPRRWPLCSACKPISVTEKDMHFLLHTCSGETVRCFVEIRGQERRQGARGGEPLIEYTGWSLLRHPVLVSRKRLNIQGSGNQEKVAHFQAFKFSEKKFRMF